MDFELLLRPSPQRDEIDAIIVGINAMAGELESVYQDLDDRVAQRTHQLEQARRQMETLAYSDPLTGLSNRSALMRAIEECLEEFRAGAAAPSLLFLDLDAFKIVNDTHGHAIGDKVLCQLAERLRIDVREGDLIARLGGDEFAILLRSQETGAHALGLRILESINQEMMVDGISLMPGASVGIAVALADHDAERLMLEADTAMYVAKHSSACKVHEFEPYMLLERQEKAALVNDLRVALSLGEMMPVYQGLFRLEDQEIVGAEVLVRWQRPGHGLLSPAAFLVAAEEAGMMGAITEYILDEALRELSEWRERGLVGPEFKVHVNVNSRELHLLGFPDMVRTALLRYGLPTSVLALEITEDKLMSADHLHQYTLKAFRAMGVEVHIDDFGTGYSSIGYLRELAVAGVKIDKKLVDDVATDPQQADLVRAVYSLVSACGLDCVVEGIETPEQAQMLKDIGFKYAQGYLFGKPMSAADFTAGFQSQTMSEE
ncbi:putative bifunctional diguanylate cyclase/phosphodiesterase [Paeniglutamicibacter cryotolerans]|uniref:Diguanylate cyclase (GGDEF)-like protein n=1 Tax=Paeniglutamicibacter cryotolerans TaxID=670079 RepID=A0A839QH88_9MICC|nr:EAL domain-containing protein [Paeniglutamicibacter cryotolerans]MBB2994104.1 diguanylate cyclase (GGDEF)-like protein [Paeniglutamicibacter cryotolerans]